MNTKLTLGGAALLLLASSMGATAYHITGAAGPLGTSHQWNAATAIPDPTTPGSILFALAICEQDDFLGTPPLPAIATPGMGGLCSMNPAYDNNALGNCAQNAGATRSNGNAMNYNIGPCQTPLATIGAANLARDWILIQMLDENGNPIDFIGQIDGFSCATPTDEFTYDGQFAYTTDDGHVAGFPAEFAGLIAGTIPNPLALGTYEASATSAPASFCDAPRPFDQH